MKLPLLDCVLVEYGRYVIGLLLGELIFEHDTQTYKNS